VAEPVPNPELLRSLGRLARGLSAVFWGLPLALVICTQAVRTEWIRALGIVPPILVTGLLLYGVWMMGAFQPQERIWMAALNRTRLLAFVNFGLSPFLYWWSQVPGNSYFIIAVMSFAVGGVFFLSSLNSTLERLGAMLPDETLRAETRQFTLVNRWLLSALLVFAAIVAVVGQSPMRDTLFTRILDLAIQFHRVVFIALLLLPVAMTMALVWKTKEVILESVFGGGRH
jgi:hypothetical protein